MYTRLTKWIYLLYLGIASGGKEKTPELINHLQGRKLL